MLSCPGYPYPGEPDRTPCHVLVLSAMLLLRRNLRDHESRASEMDLAGLCYLISYSQYII